MFGMVSEKIIGIFEDITLWLFESFISPFADLRMIHTLIFGRDEKLSTVWGTFRPEELEAALGPLFYTMMGLAGILLMVLIVINGMRISSSGSNPQSRNVLFEFLKDLVFVGFMLVNLPLVYDLLFAINMNIVNLFDSAFEAQKLSLLTSTLDGMSEESDTEMGVIGSIFIFLILIGLTVWANFYYLMRKVTLLILMALGPVMLVFWLLPQFKSLTGAWFKELVGSIFIQAIHAFVFWTVATVAVSESSFIATVVVYLIFIPISESIRRLLMMGGDMQGGLSKAGAMLGMASIAGMAGSVKGAFQDKSVMGSLRESYQGAKNSANGKSGDAEGAGADNLKSTLGANAGSDVGTSTKAEKMLRTGDIFSKGGKAVFGMAGSIAGSPLGPVGAMIGATAGFNAGGAVGGVTGRAGAGIVQGFGDRIEKGKAAALNAKQNEFSDSLASDIADTDTANWTKENKEGVLADLKERFPDATPADLNKKFDAIQEQKREGFYQNAQANFKSAVVGSKGTAIGKDLANSATNALTDKWGEENQQGFMNQYDQENPQLPGESDGNFQARRMSAFMDKKDAMRSQFHNAGLNALKGRSLDEPMSKQEFMTKLQNGSPEVAATMSPEGFAQATQNAGTNAQSTQLFSEKGKPNVPYLASAMANAAVQQKKENFVAGQVSEGVSANEAGQNWDNNHARPAYQNALENYNRSIGNMGDSASLVNGANNLSGIGKNIGSKASQAGAFVGAASGVSGFAQGTTNLVSSLGAGVQTGSSHFIGAVHNSDEGTALTRGFKAVGPSIQAGVASSVQPIVEEKGGAVNAQADYQNSAGYMAGVIGGAGGYRVGKNIASKLTPFNQQVQQSISSPGEVMQMAQTVTDDRGNTQIAPGAVRQVITADESYIEVKTNSGENQIVSRKGAGHPGLRQGEAVYQDLQMQNDTLVASRPNNSTPSTYRLDSGGGRVPSNVEVAQNPNSLLGNPRQNSVHQPVARQHAPLYNQAVDTGGFYVEDLQQANMENVQVVVEKDRQFVTAQKDGETYRVSPVYAGDSRLGANETTSIPMNVQNGTLRPQVSPGSEVAVESTVNGSEQPQSYYTTNSLGGMVNSQAYEDMMPGRQASRVQRNLSRRAELDSVRRKQGLLG